MTDLLLLAERVEGASGPDGELDFLIWAALNGVTEITYPSEPQEFSSSGRVEGRNAEGVWHLYGFIDPGAVARNWSPYGGEDRYPKVTASLDAALTLRPEGWWVQHLGQCIGGWRCRVETNGPPSHSVGAGFYPSEPVTSPALALTAACLRARHSMEGLS